jgi:2'-5' RNA ligase
VHLSLFRGNLVENSRMTEPRAKGASLWLMPDGASREELTALIGHLAERLGVAAFVPHVTLLPGLPGPQEEVVDRARVIAAELRPLPLAFSGVDGTDTHFRCLFFRVVPTPALWDAQALAARHFGREPEEAFDPHLSLVYGDLDAGRKTDLRRELQREIPPPFEGRHLHVWRTEGPVGEWRELAVLALGSTDDVGEE